MSLSVLLDYRLEDNKEHSFEVRSTADNEDREIIKREIRLADVLCLFFFGLLKFVFPSLLPHSPVNSLVYFLIIISTTLDDTNNAATEELIVSVF